MHTSCSIVLVISSLSSIGWYWPAWNQNASLLNPTCKQTCHVVTFFNHLYWWTLISWHSTCWLCYNRHVLQTYETTQTLCLNFTNSCYFTFDINVQGVFAKYTDIIRSTNFVVSVFVFNLYFFIVQILRKVNFLQTQ